MRSYLPKTTLIFLFSLLAFCGVSQEVYYPPYGDWGRKTPAEVGVNTESLEQAIEFAVASEAESHKDLEKHHYLNGFGKEPFGYGVGPFKTRGAATGLIIKDGYIVGQWGDPDRVDMTFSVTKTFLSSVVGLAYDRDWIKLDDPVHKDMAPVVPFTLGTSGNKSDGWDTPDVLPLFETPHNQSITWDHLLRQTSDWQGTLWGKPDWADRPRGDADQWTTRERNTPGTVYKYNDTRVNLLALCIMNIWRQPLPQVLEQHYMQKIGASKTWRWHGYENSWIVMDGVPMQAVSGGGHWGGGMFINAYDQARMGYLTLRNGQWAGEQVLSPEWIEMALTPGPANKGYGFMNYFLNTDQEMYPSAPETAFTHIGAGTNMVYVDRENDLVIVARWINRRKIDEFLGLVLKALD